jgi:hypothetical protein
MNNKDFATTVMKLGGVALIVYAIMTAASYTPYLVASPDRFMASELFVVYGAQVLLPLFLGLILIYFGGTMIKRHVPDTHVHPENLESLEKVALSIMGVFLFYFAASDMISHLSFLFKVNRMIRLGEPTSFEAQMDADTFAAIVATLFEICFALWLVFGSAGLVNFFNRFRAR